ncbi:MAG: hypothetical protein R3E87_18925 [Burkholderiaceae bacterium]
MAEQFIHDPAMPGLAIAMHPALFEDALATAMRDASAGKWTISSVERVRFRYRVGRRAVIQLRVVVTGPSGARRCEAAAWLHADPRQRRDPSMPEAQTHDEAHPLELVEPVTGARLALLPRDHRLPGLRHWLAKGDELPAGADAPTSSTELVRYRPGISASLRVTRADGEQCFVKLVPPAELTDHAQRWRRFADGIRDREMRVPPLLRADPGDGSMTLACADGHDLSAWLAGKGRAVPDDTIRIGLLEIAGIARRGLRLEREQTAHAMVAQAHQAAELISAVHPGMAARTRELVSSLRDSAPTFDSVPCHGDMKPDHLLFGEGCIWLLDVDQSCRCDRLLDLVMLETRVRDGLRLGAYRPDRARRLSAWLDDAMRSDSDRPPSKHTMQRRRWLRSWSALMLARHHAQTFSPDWEARLGNALALGECDD